MFVDSWQPHPQIQVQKSGKPKTLHYKQNWKRIANDGSGTVPSVGTLSISSQVLTFNSFYCFMYYTKKRQTKGKYCDCVLVEYRTNKRWNLIKWLVLNSSLTQRTSLTYTFYCSVTKSKSKTKSLHCYIVTITWISSNFACSNYRFGFNLAF